MSLKSLQRSEDQSLRAGSKPARFYHKKEVYAPPGRPPRRPPARPIPARLRPFFLRQPDGVGNRGAPVARRGPPWSNDGETLMDRQSGPKWPDPAPPSAIGLPLSPANEGTVAAVGLAISILRAQTRRRQRRRRAEASLAAIERGLLSSPLVPPPLLLSRSSSSRGGAQPRARERNTHDNQFGREGP